MSIQDRAIEIIGVPLDLGANTRGALMGPATLRIAGLKQKIADLGYKVYDSGDIPVPIREALGPSEENAKYLNTITTVCDATRIAVHEAINKGRIPIVLGGDHSLAIGSISGAAQAFKAQNKAMGLLWFDAHADMNTPETSPSGNIHGMPLAAVLGLGHSCLTDLGYPGRKLNPKNVALVGIRDIDKNEKKALREIGIRYFTMREIDERGKYDVMTEAIAVATDGTDGVHVSVDMDGVDPIHAPGVSTPVRGGLSYREIHLALEMIADSGLMRSLDLVELNPFFDSEHRTANLAVELALSALGKAIV